MAIRASAAKEIDALVADLTAASGVKRDAAVARLRVIGARAVERLASVVQSSASAASRTAALRALDGIDDPRALDAALAAFDDGDPSVAAAAVSVARRFVDGERGAETVDRLTALALDARRAEAPRLGAVRALKGLARRTVAPLLERLTGDRSAAIRAEAAGASRRTTRRADPAADLARFADTEPLDDPEKVKGAVNAASATASLAVLLTIVERVRDRESIEAGARRPQWTMVRALAHLALAKRGSRLALYDLRESLERSSEPLPIDMLAALSTIGDASCLEPIAAAYAQSKDEWWRDRLRKTFDEIAARERLTRRHAVIRKISKRWPSFAGALLAVLLIASGGASQTLQSDNWIERLQRWTAAIDRHEIGANDAAASEVAGWSIGDVQNLAIDVKLLVAVMRSEALDPNEFRVYLTDKHGRTTRTRWRFVSREQTEVLKALAHAEARHGDENRLLKRGAMLHADIAMLAPMKEKAANPGGDPRPRRVRMYFADGRGLTVLETTPHWNIARALLDDVRPSPEKDDMVRLWYQATAAYEQHEEELDPGHLARALALFPDDPDILFFNACLHETYAAPAAHEALREMTPPIGLRLDVDTPGGELRRAERLFRRAVNARPDFVEARLRLGRVLGLNGRHQDAANELRRAMSEADDPLLLYYAALFLGGEESALDRTGEARTAYERAAALFPLAQAPHLALSELARRTNDRAAARAAIEPVLTLSSSDDRRNDPWWSYHVVQGRTASARLKALRRMFPANRP